MALVAALPSLVAADEANRKTSAPGFRPYSEHASSFVQGSISATILVHPTLLRAATGDMVYADSQNQVIDFLRSNKIARAAADATRVDLGPLSRRSQWELFLSDVDRISEHFQAAPAGDDYHLFVVLLAPVSSGEIFGIHCYLVDAEGQNAFSFLLNSHHRLFANAKLTTKDTSERGRAKLVRKATAVAMEALNAQIRDERAARPKAPAPASRKVEAGIFENFESTLRSGTDASGIQVGSFAASDEKSTARISLSKPRAHVPGQKAGKTALKLDVDAAGWGVFLHKFENDQADAWVAYDWSAFNQFSFWLYGQNTGALLFVDILDNRNPPWTHDDAEIYSYGFRDDVAGWKKVSIRFRDMHRKEIGNGAPVDGLGLKAVHGWAFGAVNTQGLVTYYVDDFVLQSVPACSDDYAINELPMYGNLQKTERQREADAAFIQTMTQDGRSRESAAETVARIGWNHFYSGDCSSAIKHFNQAWLLNPKNQLALWGFAVISMDRDQSKEAIRYFEMAIESGPENASLRRDYEKALESLEGRNTPARKRTQPPGRD